MSKVIKNVYLILPNRRIGTGDIAIEGDRIAEICEHECSPEHLVMPGLINCHGHTPMTLVRGLGGGLPLDRWLNEKIFPTEAKMTEDDVYNGMVLGIMEMLAGGTTCVADMYDFPLKCEKALDEVGMRGFTCRVGLSFIEGRLEDALNFTRGGEHRHLCIHSEYLTDEKYCRKLAEANKTLKRPINFHVSETRKEHEECIARHGMTPIAYFNKTGLLDFGGYAAHGVYCSDEDFAIMRDKNISLVHNPSSNMKLGSGFARIVRAMEMGVNVALGTDGCASNDNLDMFEEMHLTSLIHKGLNLDPTALSAWEVIEMATKNGAKALGLKDVGELKVGYLADLCVINLNKLHLTPILDFASLIVHSCHASDVEATIVGGKTLYKDGEFLSVNIEKVRKDFDASVRHCNG